MSEIESFFTDHSDSGSAGLAVQQAKEIVRGNIAWLEYNESLIEKWINEYLQLFDNIFCILHFSCSWSEI